LLQLFDRQSRRRVPFVAGLVCSPRSFLEEIAGGNLFKRTLQTFFHTDLAPSFLLWYEKCSSRHYLWTRRLYADRFNRRLHAGPYHAVSNDDRTRLRTEGERLRGGMCDGAIGSGEYGN
jgi:hypothetical protein